jgi:hypothetical protein
MARKIAVNFAAEYSRPFSVHNADLVISCSKGAVEKRVQFRQRFIDGQTMKIDLTERSTGGRAAFIGVHR